MAEDQDVPNDIINDSLKRIEDNNSSDCRSSVTVSTDFTTLRARHRNLKQTVESLKCAYNLLKVTTEHFLENHEDILDSETNLENLNNKCQLRKANDLLKDATIFLTEMVKNMRETMQIHREEIEKLLKQVELLINKDEYQNETKNSDLETTCSGIDMETTCSSKKGDSVFALLLL